MPSSTALEPSRLHPFIGHDLPWRSAGERLAHLAEHCGAGAVISQPAHEAALRSAAAAPRVIVASGCWPTSSQAAARDRGVAGLARIALGEIDKKLLRARLAGTA